nr:hypothetical protein [Tanacetum cinerariifolium]
MVARFLMDIAKNNQKLNNVQMVGSTGGSLSATLTFSSAAAVVASLPFAYSPLHGIASCDAGRTSPILAEDYLTGLRTMKSLGLTIIRSFSLYYLPLLQPKVEDDDNDFLPDDERPVDLIVPFKNSVKQMLRETSVVTTKRFLERFVAHHFPQRAVWKLLKDVPKSALHKSNRGMPFYTSTFCVGRTTFRGHFLAVAASWLVQVGIECYRCVRDIQNLKMKGKICGASLIFASIGAGIGATLLRPKIGLSLGCLLGDMVGPITVSFCFANVPHLELYEEFPLAEQFTTANEDKLPLLSQSDVTAEELCAAAEVKDATITLSNKVEDPISGNIKWYQSLVRSFDLQKNNIQSTSFSLSVFLYTQKWINKTPLPKFQSWTQKNSNNGNSGYSSISNMNTMPYGSKYKTAQELWAAILKTFGSNEATKKTKKNLLKQQYENFKAEGSETLEQTFNRLQNGWRNRSDLDTMSLDDLYNHLMVYESEVQKKSELNSQNMAFISSAKNISGKEEVNTASIPTASTNVSPAGANIGAASISQDTACAYIASQSNGSQIKFEDINQIDEDDIEEMDIKWNMAILSMRADRYWKRTGKKITIQGTDVAGFDKSKVECFNCHKMDHFVRECRDPKSQDRGRRDNYRQGSKVKEQAPKALMAIDGDLSWTGLSEFADDTITDYSRPSPAIESTSDDVQNRNPSVTETEASPSTISSKPFIKFVKATDRPTENKSDKVEAIKKPVVQYAELYRKTSKKYNVRGNQRNWNNLKSQQLGENFVMKNRACFNYGHFNHLSYDCGLGVEKGKSCPRNNNTHKIMPPRPATHKPDRPPYESNQTKYECCKAKKDIFYKPAHSYRPFQRVSAGKSHNYIDDKGYWDSGCSRHMTDNISYLSDYEPFDGGYVSFGLIDNIIYSIDLINIVPHKDLTCLVAKASADGCMLWHRRLGHLNFKTMNRLVRHNLVKGLPSKCFENDHTCTACLKGKQHKASWKFEAKGDEGYFIGYFMSSKTFKVFNKRTKRVEENLHVDFLENKAIEKGAGLNWLFDIDSLTKSINYVPVVVAGTNSTNFSGTKDAARKDVKKDVSFLRYIALPNWFHEVHLESSLSQPQDACNTDALESSGNSNPTTTSTNPPADQMETLTVETPIPTVSSPVPTAYLNDYPEPSSDTRFISKRVTNQEETPSLDNILTLTNRFEDILRVTTNLDDSHGVEADVSNMETSITTSPTPTLRIHKDHPKSQIIGPMDTPIQTRNKTKEMEEQSFIATIHQKTNPDLLIKAIKLFLAYASFMGFTVYQMDVKSAFLYGTIDEEVYVMQPPGFYDPQFPAKVYKVEKAMYGLHQASRAWYGTLSKYLLTNDFQRGTIDQTLFIRRHRGDFLLVQVYVDDIIFGSSNPLLCREFEALMHEKFQMSAMGELNFFLGLQVTQKKDSIFLSQDKYVGDILKKFGYSDVRSMIGSLMYLTASRPHIMFAVCACARHQVTPKESYLDSDYGGAAQDRKSTTGGCQFLGRRIISFNSHFTFISQKEMDHQYPTVAKIHVLDIGKFKQWQFRIQQYLQHEHYALWEVIEFGNSYKVPTTTDSNNATTRKDDEKSGRTVTITTEDMQRTKNDATKKRKKNLLKQQYGNFKAEGSETLEQTFNRFGSQIKFKDINQIDENDMEEIDIKWSMALLSMRAEKFWKRSGKKISIQGSDVAGFDKSKVECFNYHKMGHF